MLALDSRLPAVLKGDDKPKEFAEGLAFGQLCFDKTIHAAATRLSADALAADPARADYRQAQPRYNAARRLSPGPKCRFLDQSTCGPR
jgi:hypothetical protein